MPSKRKALPSSRPKKKVARPSMDNVIEEVLRRFGQKYNYNETLIKSIKTFIEANYSESIKNTYIDIKNQTVTFVDGIKDLFNFLDREIRSNGNVLYA